MRDLNVCALRFNMPERWRSLDIISFRLTFIIPNAEGILPGLFSSRLLIHVPWLSIKFSFRSAKQNIENVQKSISTQFNANYMQAPELKAFKALNSSAQELNTARCHRKKSS